MAVSRYCPSREFVDAPALTVSDSNRARQSGETDAMTALSLNLSRAIARGRAVPTMPVTRSDLLVTLLRKRAAAHNAGSPELEALLRDQIRWALPVQRC